MLRHALTRVGGSALVVAAMLATTPAALAQRGHAGGGGHMGGGHMGGAYYGGHYGGYNHNFYGNQHRFYGYPFGAFALGFGLGYGGYGYGGYGGYGYGYPDSYAYSPGYDYPYSYPYATPAVPMTTESQSMYRPPAAAAQITVTVPPDAQLWVQGQPMTQTGAVRQFVTPATLQPGQIYHYVIKAQWMQNGQPVTQDRAVNFQAGNQITVDFTQPPPQ